MSHGPPLGPNINDIYTMSEVANFRESQVTWVIFRIEHLRFYTKPELK